MLALDDGKLDAGNSINCMFSGQRSSGEKSFSNLFLIIVSSDCKRTVNNIYYVLFLISTRI